MKELSLHILDLAENSVTANASIIRIIITENTSMDTFEIEIDDNGDGMDEEFIKRVTDPFVTTRKTRKVGLGIPLMKLTALRCEGDLEISSRLGIGTKIYCYFKRSHIDRPPLGNIGETIVSLINYCSSIDVEYKHIIDNNMFVFNTKEVREMLKNVDICNEKVLIWIRDYINENIRVLYRYKK